MTTKNDSPSQIPLYPLLFVPIYQYRVWGGRELSNLLTTPLPKGEPIGEAWLLSDREDQASVVANGPLRGRTLGDLIREAPEQLLGSQAKQFQRFPLLLKFLNAHAKLSVQVHPSDEHKEYLPLGEAGKTEAWVVLEAEANSLVYLGLTPGTNAEELRRAVATGTVADHLVSFTPKPGDSVLIPAGTVHSLSGDIVVFEIQQNSDVTFRLYDWDQIDPRGGQPRELQIDQALACTNFAAQTVGPVVPVVESAAPVLRERLIFCDQFGVWRLRGKSPFSVGAARTARILILTAGQGEVEYGGESYPIKKGDAMLLPAVIGACLFRPSNEATLLEISLPEATEHN